MEIIFQMIHTVVGVSYLILSQITFICVFFVGGSWRLEPTTLAKTIKFIIKAIPTLLVVLGVLYFVCYSFRIYWWGTVVFFIAVLLLIGITFWSKKSNKPRNEFLEELSDWKVFILWDVPLLIYVIYIYHSGLGIFFAYDDMQSIFGTYLP